LTSLQKKALFGVKPHRKKTVKPAVKGKAKGSGKEERKDLSLSGKTRKKKKTETRLAKGKGDGNIQEKGKKKKFGLSSKGDHRPGRPGPPPSCNRETFPRKEKRESVKNIAKTGDTKTVFETEKLRNR